MKYPEYIMERLRQRYDLAADDTSMDCEFGEWTKGKVFREVLEWEGICGYSDWLLGLVEDIYGIELKEDD